MDKLLCTRCGGEIEKMDDIRFQCKYCKLIIHDDSLSKQLAAYSAMLNASCAEMVSDIANLIDANGNYILENVANIYDQKEMQIVARLKRQLWPEVNQEVLNRDEIKRLCHEIKTYADEDFYASFYDLATSPSNDQNDERLARFIDNIDLDLHYDDVSPVLDFLLKTMTNDAIAGHIANLIQRAYDNDSHDNNFMLLNEYQTRLGKEVDKLSSTLYIPSKKRDAFICYAKEDADKVMELVDFLEKEKVSCFVSMRNIKRGSNAASDIDSIIHTAIDHCGAVVFVSSKNSRSTRCNTFNELEYVNSSQHMRTNGPMKRIHYLLDNRQQNSETDNMFFEFFEGTEPCVKKEDVFRRLKGFSNPKTVAPVQEKTEEESVVKAVKYCKYCGTENPQSAKFCTGCAQNAFVDTKDEFVKYLMESNAELKRIKASDDRNIQRGVRDNTMVVAQNDYGNLNNPKNRAGQGRSQLFDGPTVSASRPDVPRQESLVRGAQPQRPQVAPQSNDPLVNYNPKNRAGMQQHSQVRPVEMPHEQVDLQIGQRIIISDETRTMSLKSNVVCKVDNLDPHLYVLLLDNDDRLLSSRDVIYFKNSYSLNNSFNIMAEGKNENINILLGRLGNELSKAVFMYGIANQPEAAFNMTMVKSLSFTFTIGKTDYKYTFENLEKSKSIHLFELYRYKNEWRIKVLGVPNSNSIAKVCKGYGANI